MAGIEVKQRSPPERREQRLPDGATKVQQQVRVADRVLDVFPVFAEYLGALEGLEIQTAIKDHYRAVTIQAVTRRQFKEVTDNPGIRIGMAGRLHQFKPQYFVAQVLEA